MLQDAPNSIEDYTKDNLKFELIDGENIIPLDKFGNPETVEIELGKKYTLKVTWVGTPETYAQMGELQDNTIGGYAVFNSDGIEGFYNIPIPVNFTGATNSVITNVEFIAYGEGTGSITSTANVCAEVFVQIPSSNQ